LEVSAGQAIATNESDTMSEKASTTIKNCLNYGSVVSKGDRVGGICGSNSEYSYVTNCYIAGVALVSGKSRSSYSQ